MPNLKVTTWNVENMRHVFAELDDEDEQARRERRRANIAREILDIEPDVLCIQEGPPDADSLREFCSESLDDAYVLVESSSGDYRQRGRQWIWFLVKKWLDDRVSLQPTEVWKTYAGISWAVHYWGDLDEKKYRHYRHPQVLVLQWGDTRVEFIGAHLKSKYVRHGRSDWEAGGERRDGFIREAIEARIKLATGATNVRKYIDRRFEQESNPAIFLLGDANDGPGREYFEDRYLFFDLLSTLQGDVFFARRFFNHALFDYDDALRWSARFTNFVEPHRDPRILIDHVLFSQGLVDGSLPLHVPAKAGLVEHQIHELVNAGEPQYAQTSDHRPVSVHVETEEPPGE